jgi:hypothetical protein
VEPEMYGYASYNWSHWTGDGKLKEKSGGSLGKTFSRFTTADSLQPEFYVNRKFVF